MFRVARQELFLGQTNRIWSHHPNAYSKLHIFTENYGGYIVLGAGLLTKNKQIIKF
jgi:hypothetical protein